jgi:hypothetical protein
MITPPFALNIFAVATAVPEVESKYVVRGIWWFFVWNSLKPQIDAAQPLEGERRSYLSKLGANPDDKEQAFKVLYERASSDNETYGQMIELTKKQKQLYESRKTHWKETSSVSGAGPLLKLGCYLATFSAPENVVSQTKFIPGVIDNGTGLISLVSDSYVDLPPNPSGDGVLANIEFLALAPGVSPLTFSNVFLHLLDQGFDIGNGQITVTAVPEPATLMLLAGGLALFGMRRLARRGRRDDL